MPHYLDNNIYTGMGDTASDMGSAFTRAIVGTQQLQYQQAQMRQQQAMEAARLEMERQKLIGEMPIQSAQARSLNTMADLNRGKLTDLQTGAKAGGMLGDVMKGIGETDASKNPETMRMLQAIAAQQQAILASQNPSNIARQSADIQLGMSPEGRRFVSAGYPPSPQRQYMTPQQEAQLRMALPLIQGLARPERDPMGMSAPEGDIQGAADVAQQVYNAMFGGGTNAPAQLQAPVAPQVPQTPTIAPSPTQVALPKVGEIRKGYRYKGGDPAQQSSWEVVQ